MIFKFASFVMDLSWSIKFTRFIVGSIVQPSFFAWEELNHQIANYNLLARDPWVGGFLDREEVLQDSLPRVVYISFMNGLVSDSSAPIHY